MSSFTDRAGALSRSYNRRARREAKKAMARHGTEPHACEFLQVNNSNEYRCACGLGAPDWFYNPDGEDGAGGKRGRA